MPCIIPLEAVRADLLIANSRFIASLAPAFSVEEARQFIDRIRHEFNDATHNVPVYLVGCGNSVITHCSDDGEPSGTAGRPALAVLQGSGLSNTAVVITRYFGGTKLGTGGLVRAYSDSVRAALGLVRRAEKIPVVTVMLGLPYSHFDQTRLMISRHQGEIIDQDFAVEVTLSAQFPAGELAGFQNDLQEFSSGKLLAEVIEQGDKVVPLPNFPSQA